MGRTTRNGRNEWMVGYDAGTTEEAARAAFERMYGYPPEEFASTGGAVFAGPLKKADADRRQAGAISAHRQRNTIDNR